MTRREQIEQLAERLRLSHNDAKYLLALLSQADLPPPDTLNLPASDFADWLRKIRRLDR